MITRQFLLICRTCGKPLYLIPIEDGLGHYEMQHDTACEKPVVEMICHNPRKLGVIIGISEV